MSNLQMKRLEKERQAAKESLSLWEACRGSKRMWVLKERGHQKNRCRRKRGGVSGESRACILHMPKGT